MALNPSSLQLLRALSAQKGIDIPEEELAPEGAVQLPEQVIDVPSEKAAVSAETPEYPESTPSTPDYSDAAMSALDTGSERSRNAALLGGIMNMFAFSPTGRQLPPSVAQYWQQQQAQPLEEAAQRQRLMQRLSEASERRAGRQTEAERYAAESEARRAAAEESKRRFEAEFEQRERLAKEKLAAQKEALDKKLASKRGKGGGASSTKAPILTDAEVDAMDATPQQKKLLKASIKSGDKIRTSQIINEVAKLEAEKGKAKVATEADYKDVIRKVEALEKASKKDGVPVGLHSRFAYADPSAGDIVAGGLRFASNIASTKEEQENRRKYRTLIDTIRKEQFGASFTGGEKVPYQEMFGLEASAEPSIRVNAIKDIKAKAQEQLKLLQKQRRGDVPDGAPKSSVEKIVVRNAKTGETLRIDPSDEADAARDGFKRVQ